MKKRSIILPGVMALILSSCVYSLFPIYTKDTLVFKEELLGKWLTNEGGTEYLLFESANDDQMNVSKKGDDYEYKYSIKVNDEFTMSSDEPISMVIDGDTIYDHDAIREEMRKKLSKVKTKITETSNKTTADKIADGLKSSIRDKKFEGTVSVYENKSYKLTIHENNKEERYTAHLANIGGELFMDLYPEVAYSSSFSDNFFPVHTFFKVTLRDNELDFTFFDLDKLNKLFESNLIRLRHENVDGTILITAQPEELQKFLDKYSDDDSVFETTETYRKAL